MEWWDLMLTPDDGRTDGQGGQTDRTAEKTEGRTGTGKEGGREEG